MNTLRFLSSFIRQSLQKDPVRDGEEHREEPHYQAANVNDQGVPAGVHLGGVDDGQVAVQTDAGQEEDPAVEVDLKEQKKSAKDKWKNQPLHIYCYHIIMCCYYRENSSGDLAQSCAKVPPRSLTGLCSPQGQRHQQQDICHTQMEDEGVGHTPSLPAP